MADRREDDVGGIAGAAFEVAAAEMTLGFQVSDDGLDAGAAAQLALDDTEDAALLAGDKDRINSCFVCLPACDPHFRRSGKKVAL